MSQCGDAPSLFYRSKASRSRVCWSCSTPVLSTILGKRPSRFHHDVTHDVITFFVVFRQKKAIHSIGLVGTLLKNFCTRRSGAGTEDWQGKNVPAAAFVIEFCDVPRFPVTLPTENAPFYSFFNSSSAFLFFCLLPSWANYRTVGDDAGQ